MEQILLEKKRRIISGKAFLVLIKNSKQGTIYMESAVLFIDFTGLKKKESIRVRKCI